MHNSVSRFDDFRAVFLRRYAETQKTKLLAPWHSLQEFLKVYECLMTIRGSGVIERAHVKNWLTRINKRIAQLNVTDERADCCGLLCS